MWFNKDKKPKLKLNSEWLGYSPKSDRKAFEEELVRKIAAIPGELWNESYFSEEERSSVFSGYKAIIGDASEVQVVQRNWSEKLQEGYHYRVHIDRKLVAEHKLILSSYEHQINQGSDGHRGIASVYDYIRVLWRQRTAPQREAKELMRSVQDAVAQKGKEQHQSYKDNLYKF